MLINIDDQLCYCCYYCKLDIFKGRSQKMSTKYCSSHFHHIFITMGCGSRSSSFVGMFIMTLIQRLFKFIKLWQKCDEFVIHIFFWYSLFHHIFTTMWEKSILCQFCDEKVMLSKMQLEVWWLSYLYNCYKIVMKKWWEEKNKYKLKWVFHSFYLSISQ